MPAFRGVIGPLFWWEVRIRGGAYSPFSNLSRPRPSPRHPDTTVTGTASAVPTDTPQPPWFRLQPDAAARQVPAFWAGSRLGRARDLAPPLCASFQNSPLSLCRAAVCSTVRDTSSACKMARAWGVIGLGRQRFPLHPPSLPWAGLLHPPEIDSDLSRCC